MSITTRTWVNCDGSIGTAYKIDVGCGKLRVRAQYQDYAEAVAEEARTRTSMLDGRLRTGKETVKDIAMKWLAHIEMFRDSGDYTDSHLRNCKNHVMNYIINDRARLIDTSKEHYLKRMVEFDGTLGHLRLRETKSHLIFDYLVDLKGCGASNSLVDAVRTRLYHIFKHARLLGLWTGENPAAFKMPKGHKGQNKKVAIPSDNNIKLLQTVSSETEKDMLRLSIDAAPRLGEIFPLRYGDFKYEVSETKIVSEVHINFTVNESRNIVPAKTDSGIRIVPLPEVFVKKIRDQRERLGKKEDDFVFTKGDSMFVHNTFYERVWYPLRARAEAHQRAHPDVFEPLPYMTWKSLRHFGISRWIEGNFSDIMLTTYAGHKSIETINNTYAHLMAGRDKLERMTQLDMTLSNLFDT